MYRDQSKKRKQKEEGGRCQCDKCARNKESLENVWKKKKTVPIVNPYLNPRRTSQPCPPKEAVTESQDGEADVNQQGMIVAQDTTSVDDNPKTANDVRQAGAQPVVDRLHSVCAHGTASTNGQAGVSIVDPQPTVNLRLAGQVGATVVDRSPTVDPRHAVAMVHPPPVPVNQPEACSADPPAAGYQQGQWPLHPSYYSSRSYYARHIQHQHQQPLLHHNYGQQFANPYFNHHVVLPQHNVPHPTYAQPMVAPYYPQQHYSSLSNKTEVESCCATHTEYVRNQLGRSIRKPGPQPHDKDCRNSRNRKSK